MKLPKLAAKESVHRILARSPHSPQLRLGFWGTLVAALTLTSASPLWAINCATQAAIPAADRAALLAAATPLAAAMATQNLATLQGALLPAIAADWESIRGVAQGAAPLLKGGELRWRNVYLLDATDLKAPSDAQFFCTNADSSITVTISLHSLPPGRYGLLLGDYPMSPLAGQIAFILGNDSGWKLGGLFAREGALEGHDGVWYWTRAREQAQKPGTWSAYFSYEAARLLLLPVDFLSSPNLEQLNREQAQLKSSPLDSLPLSLAGPAGKTWRITALHFDSALHVPDLSLTYEGTGLTEPVAARAEAVSVMSALLKQHPDLRENFHGLWAYAESDGKRSFAIEQAMRDIP